MQFLELLKENEFCLNLQCCNRKETFYSEEQYLIDRLESSQNIENGGKCHLFVVLCQPRHGEIGIFDHLLSQLSSLATYLSKLGRSTLWKKKFVRVRKTMRTKTKP